MKNAMATFAVGMVLLSVVLYSLVIWTAASVVTSSIKSITNSCGTEYGIENIGVEADWFCPSRQEN